MSFLGLLTPLTIIVIAVNIGAALYDTFKRKEKKHAS